MSRPASSPTAARPHGAALAIQERMDVSKGFVVAFLALLVSLVFTWMSWQYAEENLRAKERTVFTQRAQEVTLGLDKRLALYIDGLKGFQGLFAASKGVERDEFSAYFHTVRLAETYPGITGISFTQRVSAAEQEAYVQHVRADTSTLPTGYPAFAIHPESQRDEHMVVTYVEPYAGNEAALGYDMSLEPRRSQALRHACDTGEPTATELLTLVIDEGTGRQGLLVYLPVYRNGIPHTTLEERRTALIGFVVGGFRVDDLVQAVMHEAGATQEMTVAVAESEVEPDAVRSGTRQGRASLVDATRGLRSVQRLTVAGRTWELAFHGSETFRGVIPGQQLPLLVLVIGLVMSLLLFGLLCSLTTSRYQALRLATNMTGELRASERRYANLIASAPDPIITLSLLGMLQSMNPAAERVSGYKDEELRGKHFIATGVLTPASSAFAMKEFAMVLAGMDRPPVEYELVCKDGTHLMLEANPQLILDQGRRVGVQVIFRDVTERKRLEEERAEQAKTLERSNQAMTEQQKVMRSLLEDLQTSKDRLESQEQSLRTANKRLQEMAALKDEFVAKVSHELRTPLTSIKEGLSLIIDNALGETTPEQQDFLRTMDADLDRLAELINNMLDLSKIEAGRMRLARSRVVATELIEGLIRSYQPIFGHRRVRVECAEMPTVFVDRNRMLQVFTNLISNAVKFTKDDGEITFAVSRRDGMVALAVKDSGPGIATEDLPKLFQKFAQVGGQHAERPRGTGLGLVVCKELTELHQGRMEVASKVGQGATFTVLLPPYTDAFALAESFREMLGATRVEEGEPIGVIAIQAEKAVGGQADEHGERLERLAESVKQHLHRGDVVLGMQPATVVILAQTDAEGITAIIHRLREKVPGADQLRFGSAVYPADGADVSAVLAQATVRLEQGVEVPQSRPEGGTAQVNTAGQPT